MLDDLTIIHKAFLRTIRLVSSARLRPPVLELLVDKDQLADLAELEGATSKRLMAGAHGTDGIHAGELVHGVPHARFINASFVYDRPRSPNRFNGADRGAWYAALTVDTSIREVGNHLTKELATSAISTPLSIMPRCSLISSAGS